MLIHQQWDVKFKSELHSGETNWWNSRQYDKMNLMALYCRENEKEKLHLAELNPDLQRFVHLLPFWRGGVLWLSMWAEEAYEKLFIASEP